MFSSHAKESTLTQWHERPEENKTQRKVQVFTRSDTEALKKNISLTKKSIIFDEVTTRKEEEENRSQTDVSKQEKDQHMRSDVGTICYWGVA